MNRLSDGRVIHVARNSPDPVADACLLADAIVAADVLLFNVDGVPMWARDEKFVQINRDVLPQLVEKYVVAPKAVFTSSGEVAVKYEPYPISEAEIRFLLSGKSEREGGLKFRLLSLHAPSPPVVQPELPVRAGAEDAAARVSHSALAAR
jgi:hypothetical protein